jgi:F0F1-type ATP synthase assembly protein I
MTTSIRAWRLGGFGSVLLLLVFAGFLLVRRQHAALSEASVLFHEATMAASDKHPDDAALDTSLARLADAKFDEARALRTRARLFQGAEYLIVVLGLALLIVRFSGTASPQE